MKEYFVYKKFISELLKNQNNTSITYLQDIYKYKDYERILKPVLDAIYENPHANLTNLRLKLFLQSGLKEIMNIFVNTTKITPGVLLDFGTFNTRDTVLCGLRQEVDLIDGRLVSHKLPIEQDTIFDLASTSKTFTAVAILILEENNLKFRVKIITDKRVDSAKNKQEALQILYTAHPDKNQQVSNAYTDMGAMILRCVIEKVTDMTFDQFVNLMIFKKAHMKNYIVLLMRIFLLLFLKTEVLKRILII